MNDLLKNLTYEEAMVQIDNIIKQLEDGKIAVDQMASAVEKAQSLLKFCEDKLRQIESKIKGDPD